MYYFIFGILFLCATITLAVLTFYAFNEQKSQGEKIGFTVGAIVSLILTIVLIIMAVNKGKIRVYPETQDELVEEDPYSDLTLEEREQMANASNETLKRTLGKLKNIMSIKNMEQEKYEDYDNYFRDTFYKILTGERISNLEKKKTAIDFFRASEYFGETTEPTNRGERLVRIDQPGQGDYERGLLEYMGTGFEKIIDYDDKFSRLDELPDDIIVYQTEIKGLEDDIERGVNKINIPDKKLFGLSPLDYFINKKKEEVQDVYGNTGRQYF